MTLENNPLARQSLSLYKDFGSTDTSFQTIGRFERTSDNTYDIGKQMLAVSLGSKELVEGIYINATADPSLVLDRSSDGKDSIYQYTVISRGIHSDNLEIPPTLYSVGKQNDHGAGAIVSITVDPSLFSSLANKLDEATAVANTMIYSARLGDTGQDVSVNTRLDVVDIPSEYSGFELTFARAVVDTAGTTGDTTIQIYNETDSVDMLSAVLTIPSGATESTTYTIDPTNKLITTNDRIIIKVVAVSATAPKSLNLTLKFTS